MRVGECCLTRALSPLGHVAAAIGAHSVSVMVLDEGKSLRVLYQWPETSAGVTGFSVKGDEVEWGGPWEGVIDRASAAGQFLGRVSGAADSFFLVPWPDRQLKVIVAFGMRSAEQHPLLPDELSPTVHLAALAAWSTAEVGRLRRELSVVNERLGRRKVVERAKGLLQARNGWSEQQAYEELRKLSRQRRKTLADTAENLLRLSRGT